MLNHMKRVLPFMLALAVALSSCQAIGTIFKAGMWWGIILVVIVIVLVIWLLGKMSGGSKS
ncbi:hypothetical protein DXN05_04085 [Deminuibacter soli]|uniref:Phosphatidate cytidylyltransferase n=2 Tax=Deminuibacter soli TaxID=2291815 RepID=A0A3E1NQF9_9BACT|nr:hypothetical protein DXN05_04085 [Deminuibacter soli]